MPASRSLIALLVGTVVFFALWMFALKPSSSNNGGSGSSSKGGLGAFRSDVNKAHQAVATSNASNAASGNDNATASSGGAAASHPSVTPTHTSSASSSSHRAAKPTTATSAKPSTKSSASSTTKSAAKPSVSTTAAKQHTVAAELSTMQAAVSAHRVLALLFYNPAAADDQAVKQELASVPTHKGQVVKLAIPLNEASSFTAVTQQVPLNLSPTLVLISRTDNATELVGFSDSFEIDQRVANALAAS